MTAPTPKQGAQTMFELSGETAAFLRSSLPAELQKPRIAVVCGSGLGGLQKTINAQPRVDIPYAEIPNFAKSTVPGHDGKLVFGTMGESSVPVVLLVGRVHYYEGHEMSVLAFATRVCKQLGVETMIVTNAAGGLNPSYSTGDIVLLNDHLNLLGMVGINPLRGPNEEGFGVRFPPLSDAYSLTLRRRAHQAWKDLGLDKSKRRLHEGIYAFVGGPHYETRAECRMLHSLGADVVGMSTVPEVVTARHCGLNVLAFSLVTNMVVLEPGLRGDDPSITNMTEEELKEYLSKGKANHEEVMEEGRQAAETMEPFVKHIVQGLASKSV